jgi:hypothetical protein
VTIDAHEISAHTYVGKQISLAWEEIESFEDAPTPATGF